jgi:anthranilate synthase component 1
MAVAKVDDLLGAEPTLAEVRELARDYNLVVLAQSFVDDIQTPVSAFLRLRGTEPAFLLESAERGRVGRYSFIGFAPREVLRWSLADGGDPYALLARELSRFRPAPLVTGAPAFSGGAVGMFAYDLVRTAEPLGPPNPDTVGLPDLAVMLTDALVVFDHLKHTLTVLANVYCEEDLEASYARACNAIAEVRRRLAAPLPPAEPIAAERPLPEFAANMPRERFERSGGRRRWRWRRSRSTGGCAR